MNSLPVGLKNLIDSISKKTWIILIFLLVVLLCFYFYFSDKKIKIPYLEDEEWIKFEIITKEKLDKFENIDFIFHTKSCTRKDEINKLVFICEKVKLGLYDIKFGEFKEKKNILDNVYTYDVYIDKEKYIPKDIFVKIDKNKIFTGQISIIKESDNTPKYTNTNHNFNFKINTSDFVGNIKNGVIFFNKPWDEFSNTYYGKKISLNYEIDNEKFYSYKPYFLTKDLDIEKLFSIGQNNENITIKDVLKIKDNNLEVLNYSKKLPNINLFRVQTHENKNGYIKFRIRNMNKDNIFNLYMNNRHVFKYEYPNFKFDIREQRESENSIERVHIGTQSFIQDSIAPNEKEAKFEKGIIRNLYFLFEKKDNNCKLTVNADKYKKVTKEFLCEDDSLNEIINSQLHIENSKCTNNNDKKCVLFEISDLETGLDYTNSPTRDYKY